MLAIILSNQDSACLSTSHKHLILPFQIALWKFVDHLMTLVQTDVSHSYSKVDKQTKPFDTGLDCFAYRPYPQRVHSCRAQEGLDISLCR
jgi:hypothetical protein